MVIMSMPYKVSKIKLPHDLDRRHKLSELQKREIIAKYKTGQYSQRSLAEEYHVNKNTILCIVNPESRKAHNERNRRSYANSADKHRASSGSYRKCVAYKRDLLSKGLISTKGDNEND